MKKIISFLTVVMLLICALTGCGGNKEAVATDGSTSMNKVIGALGEAFENKTGITVTYNATGSGAGIQAVQEGRCDIGLASRNLKDEEKANGLEGTVLAFDGIAIIVNPNNPVSDLKENNMIWCVDDDNTTRDIEVYTLTQTGFEAKGFADGISMLEALKTEKPELIVLDITVRSFSFPFRHMCESFCFALALIT